MKMKYSIAVLLTSMIGFSALAQDQSKQADQSRNAEAVADEFAESQQAQAAKGNSAAGDVAAFLGKTGVTAAVVVVTHDFTKQFNSMKSLKAPIWLGAGMIIKGLWTSKQTENVDQAQVSFEAAKTKTNIGLRDNTAANHKVEEKLWQKDFDDIRSWNPGVK